MILACYSVSEENSSGREVWEPLPLHRGQFQRDRDRIIHSSAFRRLEYKTQVFVNHSGDMFRTRLTHSIEVSQIGRTIGRALQINEDLTESICLSHDLGHSPFGHAGQHQLNRCMEKFGGFEHNLQSLRVVDVLEKKYAEFAGLNLMYETREGILKHCPVTEAVKLGRLGKRFLHKLQPNLEAQVADIADQIAYNSHDIDDGLRACLLTLEQLQDCELFARQYAYVNQKWPYLPNDKAMHEVKRRIIDYLVNDVILNSRLNIKSLAPATVQDIRQADRPLISLTENVASELEELQIFLVKNLYKHPEVEKFNKEAKQIVKELFDNFMLAPDLLPADTRKACNICKNEEDKARVITDYIAGMTDRFAYAEFDRVKQ